MAVTCVYRCLQFRSLVAITYIAYEGEGRDGYRDQIVTCDVGVSLHSKTSTVYEVEQWHKHTVLCISLSELVSCAFSTIPICPFFNSKNFSFTCTLRIFGGSITPVGSLELEFTCLSGLVALPYMPYIHVPGFVPSLLSCLGG